MIMGNFSYFLSKEVEINMKEEKAMDTFFDDFFIISDCIDII